MKAIVVFNPTAGPRDVRRGLARVRESLTNRGWSVDIQETEKPGDCIRLARTAACEGYGIVIVAGGDGTVNEAVNGLVGTQTALGVLPVGTGNMWAKQLGIPTYTLTHPMRLQEAATGLAEGTVRLVDVGQVNDRYFLCWAGIGLDAQVTVEMEPRTRQTKRLGALPYAIATVLVAREFKGVRTHVTMDGRSVRGRTLLILVSNIQQYMGMLNVAPRARLDDGLLDVFVFKGLGFPYAVRHLMKVLSQRYLQDSKVVHRQVREIKVTTEWHTPVQVDGEPIGTTPVKLRVVPQALHVVVPPSASPGLFTANSSP